MASTSRITSSIDLNVLVVRADATRLVDTESEEFAELCDSIAQFGVLHPILIRPKGDKYEILSGLHRYEASKHLGLTSIPCKILRVKDDLAAAIVEFATNAIRKDPRPCEYARAVNRILDKLGGNTKIHKLCAVINKGPVWIRDRLTLLALHPDVQKDVDANVISIKSGVILSKVGHEVQLKLRILARDLTAKQLASLIRDQRVTSAINHQLSSGCTTKQRLYPQDFTVRTKKDLSKALDDPYQVSYACSRPFSPEDARVAREVLHWVCKLDPESVIRRRQILEARKVGFVE